MMHPTSGLVGFGKNVRKIEHPITGKTLAYLGNKQGETVTALHFPSPITLDELEKVITSFDVQEAKREMRMVS